MQKSLHPCPSPFLTLLLFWNSFVQASSNSINQSNQFSIINFHWSIDPSFALNLSLPPSCASDCLSLPPPVPLESTQPILSPSLRQNFPPKFLPLDHNLFYFCHWHPKILNSPPYSPTSVDFISVVLIISRETGATSSACIFCPAGKFSNASGVRIWIERGDADSWNMNLLNW